MEPPAGHANSGRAPSAGARSEEPVGDDPDGGDRAGVVEVVDRAVGLLQEGAGFTDERIVLEQLAERAAALSELFGDFAQAGERGFEVVGGLLVVNEGAEGTAAAFHLGHEFFGIGEETAGLGGALLQFGHPGQQFIVEAGIVEQAAEGALAAVHLIGDLLQVGGGAAEVFAVLGEDGVDLLEEAGLVFALRWLADGFTKLNSIPVVVDVPEDFPRLSPELETALFRIVQESLSNIYRHAGAAKAWITLARSDAGEISLEIRDNGKGLPDDFSLTRSSGVGLAGMRERMRELGGTLEVESSDYGVAVKCRLVKATSDVSRA